MSAATVSHAPPNAPSRVTPAAPSAAPLRLRYDACPLCDAREIAPVGTVNVTGYVNWHDRLPSRLDWVRCAACAHVFTAHYWTAQGLEEVFRKAHAGQVAGGDMEAKRQLWKPVAQTVLGLLGGYGATMRDDAGGPVWLDVGCGDGALAMTADEFGFVAVGVDARSEPVEALSALGYHATRSDFLSLDTDAPADVISMFDVLEHMPHPKPALAHARRLLRPGGLLVISLPNMASSSWRLMDRAGGNPYWFEIEHHHNFTRRSLTRLLGSSGFEVVHFDIPPRYKAQMELYARRV